MKKIGIQAAVLAALIVVLTGCGGRGESGADRDKLGAVEETRADSQSLQSPAPASGAANLAFGDTGASTAVPSGPAVSLPQSRMVIKTASLSLRVKDVGAAFARAVQLTEESGGYVQSSTRSAEGGDRADLTLRIPPQGFLPLIKSLEALGSEESKTISGEDVTEEYYDLEAELSNKLEVRGRLFQLLAQAKKVEEAIQVEQQLERVGSDVNRIKGRMKYLDTMVGLSTVNLSLYSEARPTAGEFINWSLIGNGFVVAARVLIQVLFFILQALIVLIPLGAIGGAIAWGVIAFLRARRKKGGAERRHAS